MAQRDARGLFIKGNSVAKKDLTKKMAQEMVSSDMYTIAYLLTELSKDELIKWLETARGKKLSMLNFQIIDKVRNGDMNAIKWFVEMVMGRATQQIVHSTPEGKSFKLSYERNKNSK
jgi:hypothetical protein